MRKGGLQWWTQQDIWNLQTSQQNKISKYVCKASCCTQKCSTCFNWYGGKMKKIKKILAFVLSTSMLLGGMNIQAFAGAQKETNTANTEEDN